MTASEKIDYVIAANILAKICNHELDASLLTFNRRYLTRIVDFSCNRPVRPLPLPEELADIACAREWSSIVESLTAYRPALEVWQSGTRTNEYAFEALRFQIINGNGFTNDYPDFHIPEPLSPDHLLPEWTSV